MKRFVLALLVIGSLAAASLSATSLADDSSGNVLSKHYNFEHVDAGPGVDTGPAAHFAQGPAIPPGVSSGFWANMTAWIVAILAAIFALVASVFAWKKSGGSQSSGKGVSFCDFSDNVGKEPGSVYLSKDDYGFAGAVDAPFLKDMIDEYNQMNPDAKIPYPWEDKNVKPCTPKPSGTHVDDSNGFTAGTRCRRFGFGAHHVAN